MKSTNIVPFLQQLSSELKNVWTYLLKNSEIAIASQSHASNASLIDKRINMMIENVQKIKVSKEPLITSQKKEKVISDSSRQFIAIPSKHNHIVESFKVPKIEEPEGPCFLLMAKLIELSFLKESLQQRNGAYDGGAIYHLEGAFSFYSIKDLHTLKTFLVFEEGINMLAQGSFSQSDLNQAKIAIFKEKLTDHRELLISHFVHHLDQDKRAFFRKALLSV